MDDQVVLLLKKINVKLNMIISAQIKTELQELLHEIKNNFTAMEDSVMTLINIVDDDLEYDMESVGSSEITLSI